MARVALQATCYNGSRYLPYLLASIKEQTFQDWELFLLDNGSNSEEAQRIREVVEAAGFPISFYRVEKTLNFAPGHNWLFEKHDVPYVQLLNDDAVLGSRYLEELVTFADKHPRVGALTGCVFQWNFDVVGTSEARTTRIDSMGLERSRNGFVHDRYHGFERGVVHRELAEPARVFGLSGCLPLYRRSALVSTSPKGTLFDEDFISYKEDVEVAYRFERAGVESVVVPTAKAWHRRSNSGARRYTVRDEAILHSYRNHLWLLVMHISTNEWLRWGWLILLFELAKAAHWLCLKPQLALRAWRDTVRGLPNLLAKRRWYKQHLSHGTAD